MRGYIHRKYGKNKGLQQSSGRPCYYWSRLPDSNRRPHPYHGCALPAELSRLHCMKWWWEKDSNLRRRCRQIYSLLPLTTRPSHHNFAWLFTGAGTRTRTGDLLITSQLLYLLSYTGSMKVYYSGSNGDVNLRFAPGTDFSSRVNPLRKSPGVSEAFLSIQIKKAPLRFSGEGAWFVAIQNASV